MKKPIISADSHITEPAGTYVDRIDHKYKDTAPHMVRDEKLGDVFIVKDFPRPLDDRARSRRRHRCREAARLRRQVRRPAQGRMGSQRADRRSGSRRRLGRGHLSHRRHDPLQSSATIDYKKACFDAYNLWIAEYCDVHPDRLIGIGQTAMRSVEEGI